MSMRLRISVQHVPSQLFNTKSHGTEILIEHVILPLDMFELVENP